MKRFRIHNVWNTCVAAVTLVVILGCSSSDAPKTFPVTGSVAFNGQPVVGAAVSFIPEKENAKMATGVTDKDGKFQLSTNAINDGAVAGPHKIIVVKSEGGGGAAKVEKWDPNVDISKKYVEMKDANKLSGDVKLVLPAKYASLDSTPLQETVKADGQNNFILQLVD
jgi:uncharacterized protein YfaS (alpha-2-macroglobulin family)